MNRLLPLGLVLALTTAVAAQSGATPVAATAVMDLESLTRAAEVYNHDLKAAAHRVVAAEAQLDEAWISPFFQFSAEGGIAFVPDANGIPGYTPDANSELRRAFSPALSGKVKGAIPIYTFGKLNALRQAARAGLAEAKLNRSQLRQHMVYDIRRAYFGMQLALDTKQMLTEGLPKLQNALRQLDERIERGADDADEMGRYRLSSTVAEVEARASEADKLEIASRAALGALTGQKQVEVVDCPLVALPFEARPLVHYQDLARRERPDLGRLRQGIRAREADVSAKRAKYFPDLALALALEGTYAPGRTPWAFYSPYSAEAALVARWELDFWGNSKRVHGAEARLMETRELAMYAQDGIELQVTTRYAELRDAERRMKAWSRGHADTRRWFVSASQAHGIGVVETRELVDSVRDYFKARFNHMNSIREYNTAVAALELASGIPLFDRTHWNSTCEDDWEDESGDEE